MHVTALLSIIRIVFISSLPFFDALRIWITRILSIVF